MIFVFTNTQSTGTGGAPGANLTSSSANHSIQAQINQLTGGPAPSITGAAGADGFSISTSGATSPIIYDQNAGTVSGGGSSALSGGANGVQLSTTGANSPVIFDLNGGTINGGGPTSLIILPTNSDGVLITTTKAGSDINFDTATGTTISAANGNGAELHAGAGSSIGSDPTNNTIDGSITSTQTLLGAGVGTGWLGTATGTGNVTENIGSTGDVSGSGAGLVGTTQNGNVTFDVSGQVNQTGATGGTADSFALLPVGISGVASGNGNVSITTETSSSVSEVGAQSITGILGAGILGVAEGTGTAAVTADGSVTAAGVGVAAINTGTGAATTTIGGNVTITGASGSVTAFVLPLTVGGYALSTSSAATTDVYGGNIGSAVAGTSPDLGAAAVVLGGTSDATVNIGDGTHSASTIYANEVGVVAFNSGTGNAIINNTLDPNNGQNTINSGGLGFASVALDGGNATVNGGNINSNLNGAGGFGSSGAIALALGSTGDATVNLQGNVYTDNTTAGTAGTFGGLAVSEGGNATVTSTAGTTIDPAIGLAAVVLSGNGLASVPNNATVDSTVIGLLGVNTGTGSVLITNSTTGDVEASTGAGVIAFKLGENTAPVAGYTDPITGNADYSVVVDNTGIVNAPAGPGVGVIAFDPSATAVNNVLVSNDGSAGSGTGSITGEGDNPLDAAIGVAADGNVVIVNDHRATVTNTTGDAGQAIIALAGDSVSVTNDRRSSITGNVDVGSLTGNATLTNDRGSNWTFDGTSIVGAADEATITNSRGATIDEEGTSALVALGGDGATITNETGARINGDGTVNALAAVALSGDATITNETGARIDLTGANALAAVALDGDATINNETRGRIDLIGLNANVVFASGDAAINNFDGARFRLNGANASFVVGGTSATINNYNGAHFSLNGLNANVIVADTGNAEINNYNGARFSLNGLTGDLLLAEDGATEINNYNGAHLNLAGVSGSLVAGSTDAIIDNYNGAHLNLLGGNAIEVAAGSGDATVDNYNGGRINMIGLNSITLSAPNGVEEFDNEANSTIFNDGFGTIAGADNLQFYNSGLITQVDGHVGDLLVIDPATYTASGDSTYAADAQLGGPGSTADLLYIDGAASGQTTIEVNDVGTGPGAYNQQGIALVQVTSADGTSVPDNWVLDGNGTIGSTPVINKGLFAYYLATDPTGTSAVDPTTASIVGATAGPDERVALYSVPGYVGQELPVAITAAQDLWQESALLWEDRQSEIRDWVAAGGNVPSAGADLPTRKGPPPAYVPPAPSFNVWAKGIGSWTNSSDQHTIYPVGGPLTYDLSYHQSSYGVIGGLDYGRDNIFAPGDALIFGPLGGYLESHLNFNHSGDSFVYKGGTVGGSVTYLRGGFFVDGLAKADLLNLQINSSLGGLNSAYSGPSIGLDTVGGIGEFGYRFGFGPGFFEPIGTLTYSQTHIDTLNALSQWGANVNFGNGEDFRGAAGGRLGVTLPGVFGGHVVEAWVLGRVWDEFLNNGNVVDLLNEGPDAYVFDNIGHVYGEAKGGITLVSIGRGWSGFVDGGVKFNNQWNTITAKGGVNYQF
ncbi:hypothetical protein CWB41_13380 [Methylovirgula ligni]|nr:hypothetical protein CWB41_13380 [Methylovirgula ligni]